MSAAYSPERPLVLITGATGFVGRPLMSALAGFRLRAATRSSESTLPADVERAVVGDIDESTDWASALDDVRYVVHLAARVHVMRRQGDEEELYDRTNVRATRCLALASEAAGVKRFILMSTIKVNGETSALRGFRASDPPNPTDAYAVSKFKAEQAVLECGSRTMAVSIVRPPLVYGPGVRANFRRLLSWAQREWPMPLSNITNVRSLVSVWNLCDLIRALLEREMPIRGIFLVSDGEDVSTPELFRRLARAMGRTPRLFPMPVWLLWVLSGAVGLRAELLRLSSSLGIDMSETCNRLSWKPPLSLETGLLETTKWYLLDIGAHDR